ncbi:hypothetical protein Tco_0374880 [Tanacetum coccineum]
MSNSNINLQTQSSNALHNAIMEAGSKDRPPMLAPGNYVQWKSRIKRYIDTKPNSELIHYCLQNPPYTYQWAEKTVPVAEGSSETTTELQKGIGRHYMYMAQDSRGYSRSEVTFLGPQSFDDEPMHRKFKQELNKYNDVNYASKVEIDCAKAKGDLMSYKINFEKSSNAYTRQINELNQTISDIKKELYAHQETISIMSQAKEAQIKLYKTREDKELGIKTFAKTEFLKKAQRANPRLYDIGCYNDNLALMLAPESDRIRSCLERESRSKLEI